MPNNEDTQVVDDRKEPELSLVEDNTAAEPPRESEAAIAGDSAAGDLINLGKLTWDVIKDNRPVASQNSDNANAVPQNANFTELSGWVDEPRRMKLRFHSE